MNILLTNHCNQQCPYCFADQELARENLHMEMDDFLYLLKFIKLHHIKQVKLLGGEPTLHPEFIQFLKAANQHGIDEIIIFSNGLIKKKTLNELINVKNLSFIFNINKENFYTPENWQKIHETFSVLVNAGHYISISFNIYEVHFTYNHLETIFQKFPRVKSLRIGICNPILNEKNTFIDYKNKHLAGSQITRMVKELYKKYKVNSSFDCGFSVCMFSENNFKELYLYTQHSETMFSCKNSFPLDITTDLNAFRCFPFSNYNPIPFKFFSNLEEYYNWFRFISNKFIENRPAMCLNCEHNTDCTGLCLSHNYDEAVFNDDTYFEIIQKIYRKNFDTIGNEYLSENNEFLNTFVEMHTKNKLLEAIQFAKKNVKMLITNFHNKPEYWKFVIDIFMQLENNLYEMDQYFPREFKIKNEIVRKRDLLTG